MYTRTVRYTDFLGNEVEKELNFHMTTADLVMWITHTGTYTIDMALEHMTRTGDAKSLFETFEDLLLRSYGEISVDGRSFEKSEELSKKFRNTEAYSVMFMDLINDDEVAADFINKVIPKDLAEKVDAMVRDNPDLVSGAKVTNFGGLAPTT